jgi:N utilization substance protein B
MATSRRRGREIALQVLYGLDADPDLDPQRALALFFQHLQALDGVDDADAGGRPEQADRAFVERLVADVTTRREEIDEALGRVSRKWRVERMARVDRNILRLAIYELLHLADVPVRVTINEAIELAKRFGAAEAPAFVNGILDAAVKALDVRK